MLETSLTWQSAAGQSRYGLSTGFSSYDFGGFASRFGNSIGEDLRQTVSSAARMRKQL
jgi:hypothetical protein